MWAHRLLGGRGQWDFVTKTPILYLYMYIHIHTHTLCLTYIYIYVYSHTYAQSVRPSLSSSPVMSVLSARSRDLNDFTDIELENPTAGVQGYKSGNNYER